MKNTFVSTLALCAVMSLGSACNEETDDSGETSDTMMNDMSTSSQGSTHSEHNQMMNDMMNDMNAVKMTGNFDLDFANMMIPHHQSAVDMAQTYLPKGKDEKIKGMAQKIVEAQKKEIGELQQLINNHKPSGATTASRGHGDGQHNELMDAMHEMMDKMRSVQMTGDPDKDFVTMMIPHHESTVKMAENELSHGNDVAIKQFAQKVIDDQSTEIREFQAWLNSK